GEEQPTLEVLLRPRELATPQVPLRDVPEFRGRHVEALGEFVLGGADVDPALAGLGVLRPVAVDAVRHAPLLADLLEEARRGGASEDRVEQRHGVAPWVGAGDPRAGEDDVVLLSHAPEAAVDGRRCDAQARAADTRGAVRAGTTRLEELGEALVRDVTR